ncbi:ribonuclease H-like domain-containing protein [Tanacetum coccineum]
MAMEDTTPSILMESNSSNNKGTPNKSSSLPQICDHFNKGSCKFGDRCKFLPDYRNQAGLSGQNQGSVTNSLESATTNYILRSSLLGPGYRYTNDLSYSNTCAFSTMTLDPELGNMEYSAFPHLILMQWRNAMYDEYNALVKNGTWTLSRYKARLVANGSNQQLGVDFDKTFSPVVKLATIRTVLSLAVSRKWLIHQLDVKNAFLMVIYPRLSTCISHSILFMLGYATRIGFYHSHCDSSLFIYRLGSQVAYLLLYVDDIILTTSSIILLQHLIDSLHCLHLYASSTTSLVGYTDADWVGCPSTRSAEAKNWGVTNIVAETTWLRNLLREIHYPLSTATFVYCNNVRVLHMPSRFQYADIFTKGLPSTLFEEF